MILNLTKRQINYRNYYAKNKAKVLLGNKLWKIKNRDKRKAAQKARHNIRYKKEPMYKFKYLLRRRIYKALNGLTKGSTTIDLLGCSIECAKEYLENKFEPGMTWKNWGEWHLDHIKLLVSFDLSIKEQLKEACNYTNLQPLWASDNLSKGSRLIHVV